MTQNFYKQRRERRKLKERETRELYKWVLEKGKKRKEKRKREREGEHFAERGGGLSVFPSIWLEINVGNGRREQVVEPPDLGIWSFFVFISPIHCVFRSNFLVWWRMTGKVGAWLRNRCLVRHSWEPLWDWLPNFLSIFRYVWFSWGRSGWLEFWILVFYPFFFFFLSVKVFCLIISYFILVHLGWWSMEEGWLSDAFALVVKST